MEFKRFAFVTHPIIALIITFILTAGAESGSQTQPGAEDDYDRLDGTGQSGKKVDVIEWEGNLEVHVYPKGSTGGLLLQVDRQNKDRPVMVIQFAFNQYEGESPLVRRYILGIPIKDGYKLYQDMSTADYDKFVITNNTLGEKSLVAKTYGTPSQKYPNGHPMLAQQQADANRKPASVPVQSGKGLVPFNPGVAPAKTVDSETGAIQFK